LSAGGVAEALMKQLTGGDTLKARKLYQDFYEITPTWKIFLAANHKPTIRGADYAVWRRIKLVPFTVTISDDEKDKNLPQRLRAEWPGILAWMVRGCLLWQRDGLGEPEEVKRATDAYQAEQDTLGGFIAECCWVHAEAKAKASELFDAYQRWSGDKAMTQREFAKRLAEKNFEGKRGTGGWVLYRGIGLQDPPGDAANEGSEAS
jgi:putative DNA primase/helicase